MSEERTEAPTARKKKESRKEGQVPRTPELGAWATLLFFGMAMDLLGTREIGSLSELLSLHLRAIADPEPAKALQLLGSALRGAATTVVVLGCAVMVVGVVASVSQGGFYLATKAVKPAWRKLNLLQGAKRLLGPHALWEGAKILLKSAVLAGLVWSGIAAVMPLVGGLVPMATTLEVGHDQIGRLFRVVALAGLVMAAADYAMQRRKVGKQTRMTKQEVKQEHKNTEGDPLVKSAIRSRQLAAARNRMMAEVPQSDVVLVNPTHVAVALRYDPAKGAPTVVARGAGAVAARIRALAEENGVTIVRDVPLARALHASCLVGQEIPAELFAAVAQVLAFVIGRRTHGVRGGTCDTPRRDRSVPAVPRAGRRRTPPRSPVRPAARPAARPGPRPA